MFNGEKRPALSQLVHASNISGYDVIAMLRAADTSPTSRFLHHHEIISTTNAPRESKLPETPALDRDEHIGTVTENRLILADIE